MLSEMQAMLRKNESEECSAKFAQKSLNIRRMLSEIQALGHADAHVAPDAGNLEIPEDTSTETEAALESNEEEGKRGGMSKRGGLEGAAGECGSVDRGVVRSRTWMRLLVSCLRGDGRGAQEEERKGRGKGWRRRGEVPLQRLSRCFKYACKETSIFVPLPHMKHKQAGEQGASLCGLKTELQRR